MTPAPSPRTGLWIAAATGLWVAASGVAVAVLLAVSPGSSADALPALPTDAGLCHDLQALRPAADLDDGSPPLPTLRHGREVGAVVLPALRTGLDTGLPADGRIRLSVLRTTDGPRALHVLRGPDSGRLVVDGVGLSRQRDHSLGGVDVLEHTADREVDLAQCGSRRLVLSLTTVSPARSGVCRDAALQPRCDRLVVLARPVAHGAPAVSLEAGHLVARVQSGLVQPPDHAVEEGPNAWTAAGWREPHPPCDRHGPPAGCLGIRLPVRLRFTRPGYAAELDVRAGGPGVVQSVVVHEA